jgi:hypothetical protein
VRKLVKISKSMDLPFDAVRLENKGVWFFCYVGREYSEGGNMVRVVVSLADCNIHELTKK